MTSIRLRVMREHGLLNRVLLVYEEAARRIVQLAKLETIKDPALVNSIRQFIRMYRPHEAREDKFERMVDRVANIEKGLGIYDLAQFTPQP